VDSLIDFRNEITERTPRAMAEGYAASHAPSRLLMNLLRRQVPLNLQIILLADIDRPIDIADTFCG
jgi:hypothetical protein